MKWFTKKENMDWTHKDLSITDIRKLQKLYILKVADETITPILINSVILDERLKSYFLKSNVNDISRAEILSLKWNMYISKGRFYKIDRTKGEMIPEEKDPDKFYISFLEITGPLGSFESIISK